MVMVRGVWVVVVIVWVVRGWVVVVVWVVRGRVVMVMVVWVVRGWVVVVAGDEGFRVCVGGGGPHV